MATNINTKSTLPLTNSHFTDTNDYAPVYHSKTSAEIEDHAHEINEEKQTCLTNIRDGRESLKKIIDCFSSTMPKLNEFENVELKDCASFVDKLIEAKEGYYASQGFFGKIKVIFSRFFGSIKDATSLKHQFDSLRETQQMLDEIAVLSPSIVSGAKSLTKIIGTFTSGLQKPEEIQNTELQGCVTSINDLISAKENYFAAKGPLGKVLALCSRAFGSIKDASIMKQKIDSAIKNQEIADKLCNELNLLHEQIVKKQQSPETTEADIKKLVGKFEITLIHLNMFSKNEKHAKILSQFIDTLQNLF